MTFVRLTNLGLLVAVVLLAAYAAFTTLLLRTGSDGEWVQATEHYIRSYYAWLRDDPATGWARVEPLTRDAERARLEAVRARATTDGARGDLAIDGTPAYTVLWKSGGQAVVDATYTVRVNGSTQPVHESYVLGRAGPKTDIVVRQVSPAR